MYVMLSLTCQYQSILFFTIFINFPLNGDTKEKVLWKSFCF